MGAIGTHADAAVVTDAEGTISGKLRGIIKLLVDGGIAAVGAVLGATADAAVSTDAVGTISGKLRGVVARLASLDGKVTACNTGAVAGSVTANAGTNLNTSLLALEAGGHLASVDTKITACNTGAVAGSVTANAGTNLNTSLLALEAGGNLAAVATATGTTADAAVDGDAAGTLSAKLRGLAKLLTARLPALGPAVAASSTPVTVGGAATGTQSNVASSASSGTLLAANANRRGVTIWNDSTATLYVLCSATGDASATACTIPVYPAERVTLDFGSFPYTGLIKGIWSAVNGAARITELT